MFGIYRCYQISATIKVFPTPPPPPSSRQCPSMFRDDNHLMGSIGKRSAGIQGRGGCGRGRGRGEVDKVVSIVRRKLPFTLFPPRKYNILVWSE